MAQVLAKKKLNPEETLVTLHWKPPGKRKRGRPRTTWRRTITITSELEEMGFLWARLSTLHRTEEDGGK